jgi:hypothetical protein
MLELLARLYLIGQWLIWEWINTKYRERRAECGRKCLTHLIEYMTCTLAWMFMMITLDTGPEFRKICIKIAIDRYFG